MAACSQVVISSQGIDIDERFKHLLTPIRDLAKNWDVNIASELEAYLCQVNYVLPPVGISSNASFINWAHAALIIQGSTAVYSKKVEYLHGLVYRAVEELFSKKKAPVVPSSITDSGRDRDASFGNQHAQGFLSLDNLEQAASLEDQNRRRSALRTTPKTPLHIVSAEAGNAQTDEANDGADNNSFLLHTSSLHNDSGTFLLSPSNTHLLGNAEHRPAALNAVQNNAVRVLEAPADPVDDNDDAPPPLDDYPMQDDPFDAEEQLRVPPPPQENNVQDARPRRAQECLRIDRLQLVDKHVETNRRQSLRLLRKRIVVKLPSTLRKSRGRKRRSDNTIVEVKKEPPSPIGNYCPMKTLSNESLFPKNIALLPKSSIFENLYWNELKRRKKLLSSRQKLFGEQIEQHEENGETDDFAGDDNGPNMSYGDDLPAPHDDMGNDSGREERTMIVGDQIKGVDQPIPSSYEDLVQNYLNDMNKFCQLTDMGIRVNEWAERIKPKLSEEESKEPYDIHKYGTQILNCYNDNNRKQTLPFSRIVHGLDRCEVSRYFLASLQLANTENVQISTLGVLEEGMDTMELTLLSRKRHHENLQDFRAPSQ